LIRVIGHLTATNEIDAALRSTLAI
jgi:hypothetical protein